MGLDIYTYTKAQHEVQEAHNAKWAHMEERDWDTIPQEERDLYFKEQGALPGSDDVPSKDFPDNINNRRYLRSSYNRGGFNAIVPEVTNREDFTYYGIFEPLGDLSTYLIEVTDSFRVEECKRRAEEVVAALEALKGSPIYRVNSERALSLRPDDTNGVLTSEQALDMWRTALNEPSPHGWGWSNAHGSFFGPDEPLRVVAAIAGKDILGGPCVHLVYQLDELHSSYLESAKIVVEFCDELLDLVKQDGAAYIHWSG